MERLEQVLNQPPNTLSSFSREEYLEDLCKSYNRKPGTPGDVPCDLCFGKGYTREVRDGEIVMVACACLARRESLRRMRDSGLGALLERYTMDRYNADTPWQRAVKAGAGQYIKNPGGWFFAGGQVGSGKTHICTAIVCELMKQGKSARYFMWRDVTAIRASVNDPVEYRRLIDPLKNTQVLYIDDFLKSGGPPTQGDINIAFEVLNHRYNNPDLLTVISSEKTVDDIMAIDPGVGSRIYERTKGSRFEIGWDDDKNYRMRG